MRRLARSWFGALATATLTLAVVSAVSCASRVPAATPVAAPTPSAQERYYDAQTQKIKDEATWWNRIVSAITPVALIVAAFWTFLTYLTNYRDTRRREEDAQFFEALRRFGDKDSVALRVSGVGLLVQASQIKAGGIGETLAWMIGREAPRNRRGPGGRNYELAVDQLLTGFTIEPDYRVIDAIGLAIWPLVSFDPEGFLRKLLESNKLLRQNLVVALGAFFAESGVESLEESSTSVTSAAAAVTPYTSDVITRLIDREKKSFRASLTTRRGRIRGADTRSEATPQQETVEAVYLLADRLRYNVDLLSYAIVRYCVSAAGARRAQTKTNLSHAFLVKGTFAKHFLKREPARIEYLNFDQAHLDMAELGGVTFENVNFSGASLQFAEFKNTTFASGVSMAGADVTAARLFGAKDEFDALAETNWSAADYRGFSKSKKSEKLDDRLLGGLFERHRKDVGQAPHSSVEEFRGRLSEATPPAL